MLRTSITTLLVLAACGTVPATDTDREVQTLDVQSAITQLRAADPGLKGWFESAHGYAIFPSVGKGAVGVGGAFGRGQVFEKGEMIGFCKLTQGTVGLQLGGQAYIEAIFFKDATSLKRFTSDSFEFSAQASAVAVTAGASADADYTNGVAVFTMGQGGLMFEASIGGQQFDFVEK